MHSKSSQSQLELSQQHEAQLRELEQTIAETQESAKQELAKLKIVYEKEKEQLMSKMRGDKALSKEEESAIRAEFENRISEDEQKFDEERQFLSSQLSQLQFESQTQLDKTQRELILARNNLENL